jgi:CDP-diacylglycerol--glycerol-3-phosphate 3-phosphatidyltransferase
MTTSLGEAATRPTGGAHPREVFWNLPNTVTMLRGLAVPAILALPLAPGRTGSQVVAWTFILAATTDVVDGWLARWGQQVTRIGKLLDPLVDKLLVATSLIVLLAMDRIPEWCVPLVVVIIGRELAVTALRGMASVNGLVIHARRSGKLKTLAQNVAIGALLFPDGTLGVPNHGLGLTLLAVATLLTLWSGWRLFDAYFRAGTEVPSGPTAG